MLSKHQLVSHIFLLVYLYLTLSILNHGHSESDQPLLNQGLSQATLGRTQTGLSLLLTKPKDAEARSDPRSETSCAAFRSPSPPS
jgi:hypothetical protein